MKLYQIKEIENEENNSLIGKEINYDFEWEAIVKSEQKKLNLLVIACV